MKYAVLTRTLTGDQGTLGKLTFGPGRFECDTLELPWRGNKRGISCMPGGRFLFKFRPDGKHGPCYEEWDDLATTKKEDVPERDNCQFHSANLAGDKEKGYVSELEGCIALGYGTIIFHAYKGNSIKDQIGLTRSRDAMQAFLKEMAGDVLQVDIVWAMGISPEPFTDNGHTGGY
jgi:hypothetical protein